MIMGSLKSSNVYNPSIITGKERKVREPFTLIITYIVWILSFVQLLFYPDRDRRNSGQKPTKLGKYKNNYDNITKTDNDNLIEVIVFRR